MRWNLFLLLMVCPLVFSRAQSPQSGYDWMQAEPKTLIVDADLEVPVVDFEGLAPLLSKTDGKVRVVNFWATWWAPCIKELPYFEEVTARYPPNRVEVVLVSLDFPSMWEERLPSFIRKKQLKSPVVVLDDPDQNSWIPKVDPAWSGAIPATLIFDDSNRAFFESAFDRESLLSTIESFIN